MFVVVGECNDVFGRGALSSYVAGSLLENYNQLLKCAEDVNKRATGGPDVFASYESAFTILRDHRQHPHHIFCGYLNTYTRGDAAQQYVLSRNSNKQ